MMRITVTEGIVEVGAFGRFQLFLLLVFITNSFFNGCVTFQFQALSILPDIQCLTETCEILIKKEVDKESLICQLKTKDWMFAEPRHNWATDFELYCDNLYLKSLGTSVYFIGFMLGVSVFSSLCDRFGRHVTNLCLLNCYLVALIGLRYSTSLHQVFSLRIVLGALHSGVSITLFTAMSEFTIPKFSAMANVFSAIAFSIGSAGASFLARTFLHWQDNISVLIAGHLIVLISYSALCHETPFWLVAQELQSEVVRSLNLVAKVNGRNSLPENVQLVKTPDNKVHPARHENPFLKIIRTSFLKDAIMRLSFAWFTVSVCFYALQFNAGSLGDNEYDVMILMGFSDFPAKLLILYLANKLGRRKATRYFFTTCAVSLALCCIPTMSTMYISHISYKSVLVLIGHATGGSIFSLLYTYTSELLPTLARSTGVSICSTVARVASLLSPFVIILNQISGVLVYMIALGCILVSLMLMRDMPETLNKPLPNDIQECEVLFNVKKSKVEEL